MNFIFRKTIFFGFEKFKKKMYQIFSKEKPDDFNKNKIFFVNFAIKILTMYSESYNFTIILTIATTKKFKKNL